MKLHGENILLFGDGGKVGAVRASGNDSGRFHGGGVGMREIKISGRRNACEKAGIACTVNAIPAHVRKLYADAQSANASREKLQSEEFRGCVAGLVECLKTK